MRHATSTLTLAALALAFASHAMGATISGSAQDLAEAIAQNPAYVTGASFAAKPPSGIPDAISTTPLTGFPRSGSAYAILSTGAATLAETANSSANTGIDNGGGNVRGDTDFDVTILKIDLAVPSDADCLSIDFRFLSEEFPEYVGGQFNDAFVAELDSSTWTTSGASIVAPGNFAFDPSNNEISVNATGSTSVTPASAVGTTYDAATPLLFASTPVTPGAHSLYLSIFDQSDLLFDSAVFVDNLILGKASGASCTAGATSASVSKGADSSTTTATGTNGYTISVSGGGAPLLGLATITDVLPAGFSYVPGSTSGATTSDPTIAGQTLTWSGPFAGADSGSASIHFAVRVSATAGAYDNSAGASAPGLAVTPTGPTARVTVVSQPADLELTAGQAPIPAALGADLTYTLTVKNNGPGPASNVSVTAALPNGATFLSATATQGTCGGTSTVICSLGSLAAGQSASMTILVRPTVPGTFTASASTSATEGDPSSQNNSATLQTAVSGSLAPPGPSLGESVNVEPHGTVLVKYPGSDDYVVVTKETQIPVGSELDTTNGRVDLTSATDFEGGTQVAAFYGGQFEVRQKRRKGAVTDINLQGGNFRQCRSKAEEHSRSQQSHLTTPVRRVWGSGKGSFRTRGRWSSASVTGTTWLTEDRCGGTLTKVKQGKVAVYDATRKKTVTVPAGKSYFARAPYVDLGGAQLTG